MKIMMRSDPLPSVEVATGKPNERPDWETCSEEMLEQHIRTLQTALRWVRDEKKRKASTQVQGT